jgi:putative transposase
MIGNVRSPAALRTPRAVTHTDYRDPVQMRRAYKFRAYPTHPQEGRAVRLCRAVRGTVKTLTLKREHRRWYVIVVADHEAEPLPPTGREVGVDVGVARFFTTSAGEIVDNPRFLHTAAETIADLHLQVGNMTRTPRGTDDRPGRNVAQKAGLNRSILDAGWAQFTSILAAKAESAGRRIVLVNPAYTSIDCHACGTRCTRPRQDTVVCPRCGSWDADWNGSMNIQARAGLGSGQAPAA